MTSALHNFHILESIENSCRILSGTTHFVLLYATVLTSNLFHLTLSVSQTCSTLDEKTSELKWVLSMTTISMVFSLLVIVIHFFEGEKVKFVGSVVEGGFAVFFLALWSAGLPVIMNPDHFLAVNDGFEIMDANLYL